MKVILLTHVKDLGKKGEIREVSEGFYRNRLQASRLAVPATTGSVQHIQAQKEKGLERLANMKESAQAIADRLKEVELSLKERASESGKLYAALSAKEIVFALKNLANVEIPVHTVVMNETIKQVGDHHVKIKLHPEVQVELTVHVDHA